MISMDARDEEEHASTQSPQGYVDNEDPFRLAKVGDACRNENETKEKLELESHKSDDADNASKNEGHSRFDEWYHCTDSIPNSPLESDLENLTPDRFMLGDQDFSEPFTTTNFGTESLCGAINDFLSNDIFLNVAALSSGGFEETPENLASVEEIVFGGGSVNPLLEDANISYITNAQEEFCKRSPRVISLDGESVSESNPVSEVENRLDYVPDFPLLSCSIMNIADYATPLADDNEHQTDDFLANSVTTSFYDNTCTGLFGTIQKDAFPYSNVFQANPETEIITTPAVCDPLLSVAPEKMHASKDFENTYTDFNNVENHYQECSYETNNNQGSEIFVANTLSQMISAYELAQISKNVEDIVDNVSFMNLSESYQSTCPLEEELLEPQLESNQSVEDLIQVEVTNMKNTMFNEIPQSEIISHGDENLASIASTDTAINTPMSSSERIPTDYLMCERENEVPDGAIAAVVNDLLLQLEDVRTNEEEEPYLMYTAGENEDKDEFTHSIIRDPYDLQELSEFVYEFPSYPAIPLAADMLSIILEESITDHEVPMSDTGTFDYNVDTQELNQVQLPAHDMNKVELSECELGKMENQSNLNPVMNFEPTLETENLPTDVDKELKTGEAFEVEVMKSSETTEECIGSRDGLHRTVLEFLSEHIYPDAATRSFLDEGKKEDAGLRFCNDLSSHLVEQSQSHTPSDCGFSCYVEEINLETPPSDNLILNSNDTKVDTLLMTINDDLSIHEDAINENFESVTLDLKDKTEVVKAAEDSQTLSTMSLATENLTKVVATNEISSHLPNIQDNAAKLIHYAHIESLKNEELVNHNLINHVDDFSENAKNEQVDDEMSMNNVSSRIIIENDEIQLSAEVVKTEDMNGEHIIDENTTSPNNAQSNDMKDDEDIHETEIVSSAKVDQHSLSTEPEFTTDAVFQMEASSEISFQPNSEESKNIIHITGEVDTSHEDDLEYVESIIQGSLDSQEVSKQLTTTAEESQDGHLLVTPEYKHVLTEKIKTEEFVPTEHAENDDIESLETKEMNSLNRDMENENHLLDLSSHFKQAYPVPTIASNSTILEEERIHYYAPKELLSGTPLIEDVIKSEDNELVVNNSSTNQAFVEEVFSATSCDEWEQVTNDSASDERIATRIKTFSNVQKSGSLTELVKDSQLIPPTSRRASANPSVEVEFIASEPDNDNYEIAVDDTMLADSDLERKYKELLQTDKTIEDSSSLSSASTSVTAEESKANLNITLKDSLNDDINKHGKFEEIELQDKTSMKPSSKKSGILSRIRNWLYYITSVFRRPRRV